MPFGTIRREIPPLPAPTIAAGPAASPETESLSQTLLSLFEKSMSEGAPDELLAELAKQVKGARDSARDAQGVLQSAQAEPIPRTNTLADTIARSLGGLSADFLGKEDPRQNAEKLIKNEQTMLLMKRAENLEALEKNYERAATRAERLEDNENSIKMREKLENIRTKRAEYTQLLRGAIAEEMQGKRDEFQATRDAARDAATAQRQIDLENLRFQHDILGKQEEARLKISTSTSAKFPPELEAALKPTLDRMNQLSQAVGAISANSKIRGGEQKKRLAALNYEYSSLDEQYQAAIQSYYQKPAGPTGAGAQTPLGTVMGALKKEGARTFEDARKIIYSRNGVAEARKLGYDVKTVLEASRVMFPAAAEVNRAHSEYMRLTTGPLAYSKIRQNKLRVTELAEKLVGWGLPAKTAEELLSPPGQITLPETVVRP